MHALDAIRGRRSIGRLTEPGPDAGDLRTILEAAACAPDHGELRPYRFIVLREPAKEAFGEVLERAYRARCAERGEAPVAARAEKERTKLGRAPVVVVIAAVARESATIPWVEQRDAAVAAAQNALIAATALGYGSMWRTGDPAYDRTVRQALGLGDDDDVVGFLYLGSTSAPAAKPPRQPDLDGLVEEWAP